MTDPTLDRTELSARLSEQWDAIAALVADLDENQWRASTSLPGWTVFDVVAHVVGTESWLLGERPPPHDPITVKTDVSTLPHVRNETAVFNEIWVDRLRPMPGAQLLEVFREIVDRRRKALAAMGDEEWQALTQSPIGQVAYGRFMRVRLFDCWMHELDLADALGVQVEEGGPRGELGFAEFLGSVPRVVVKKGGAPDGSRITFVLTGALARTLHIQVAGRAGFVDSFDEPATVEIRLPSELFVRLGGGRTTADEHLDEIAISGDEELGRRLVANLAFTF
ncbi:maleylpyruvate isomerase family mycothiol-dependent enzyme [Nocardia colli]|uniref:Maleylpyruvate isomerase family mycothiol-dependent enzyme n=1 Tax=Nocardia colli TaxID=2545717 RepID=A0A5N0DV50_9NOCA|nr:maleylpyruvate isomerase family mycothiol-dependent enzyme [Nocardia colli]KAA8879834.1 maleylpyruvate isomerase family mycothiol-dependent enzyme [Nocardia colli]